MRSGTAPESAGGTVRRQVAAAARTLLRPSVYTGLTRELALSAFHVVTYPFGVVPSRDRRARRFAHTDSAETAATPVVLVHGYVHNRSAFLVMSRQLKRAGFHHVHGFNYNPLTQDMPELAALLAAEVERLLDVTGAERCMIVGHSMGGLIARYYVQDLGGEDTVDTVITLGSPHRGTYSAYLGLGPACAQLRPGSTFLRGLEETARPGDVRYIAYYSDLDVTILPTRSAKLVHPALKATNIRVRDTGHLSLLLSGEVLDSLVEHLANPDLGRPPALEDVTPLPTIPQRNRRARRAHPASASPGASEATTQA